ncbi:YcaO-like family protein [Clostridiaceae bacterium M8S5]|nr:YcaO-like family protein [Clostridiaceae bacterium M8S5]
MMRMYPSYNNVLKQFNKVAGSQTGIINSMVVPLVNYIGEPTLRSMTGTMPNYHKHILKGGQDVQYHIIGYGSYYEEAFIKYIGESIERYASLVGGKLLEDKVEYASYNEISKKGKAMPLKYMNVFTDEQIIEIKERKLILCDKRASEDDIIGWVKCPSLFNPDEGIYVPMQMLFIGYENDISKKEYRYIPAFSTGTASHKSYFNALKNSLIEYIQIDAFMINWYTKRKSKRVIIDDEIVNQILKKHNLYGEKSAYEIIPLYISLDDVKLPNYSVVLKRKDGESPFMLVGVQADTHPKHGILRGVMEALPISQSVFYNTIFYEEAIKQVTSEKPWFIDLDKNVLFYAMPHRKDEKERVLADMIEGEIKLTNIPNYEGKNAKEDVAYLIKELKKISEYAVVLDITPPEAREKGWYVTRVLVPEILEMCIPDYPFANHPRMLQYGGVKNEYPHPMP